MTEISEEIQTSEEDEKKMYADFKRKLNLEAASAQVAKLEFNLTQATVSKAELRRACQEANRLHLGAVCVLPNQVKHCVHFLGNDPQTSLVACISFPSTWFSGPVSSAMNSPMASPNKIIFILSSCVLP